MTYAAEAARRRPGIALALAGLEVAILANAFVQHDLGRALLYLAVIAMSVVLIDVTLARWPASTRPVPVRNAVPRPSFSSCLLRWGSSG